MRRILSLVMLCLMVTASAMSVNQVMKKLGAEERAVPESVYAQLTASGGDAQYYLGCEGEFVAVFADSRQRRLCTVTDIELKTLRRADTAMLRRGIPVKDEKELLRLLEDIGS